MILGGKIATADELSSLVLALYRASRERPLEEFQRAALELVKPLLPFDSGWWGSGVMTECTMSIHAVHLHDMSPDVPMEYGEVADQDPTPSAVFEHGDGVYRFHIPTALSGKKKSLEFHHLLKNHNIENMLNSGTLNRNNGFSSWISLFRADPDQVYSDRDQYLMQALLPHLMEALSINRLIHLKHIEGSQRRFPLAVADKRGMLYHAESGFMDLLREEFRSSATDRLPAALIASLDGSGRYAGRTVVIQCSQSAGLLFTKGASTLACRCAVKTGNEYRPLDGARVRLPKNQSSPEYLARDRSIPFQKYLQETEPQ